MKKLGLIATLLFGLFLYVGAAAVHQPPAQAKPIAGEHTQASKDWMAECTTRRWFNYCLDDMRRLKSAGLWPW